MKEKFLVRVLGCTVLLIALFGESYKFNGILPVGLPVIFLFIGIICYLIIYYKIQLKDTYLFYCLLPLGVSIYLGLVKNNIYYFLQDILPIFTFIIVYLTITKYNYFVLLNHLKSYFRLFVLISIVKIGIIYIFRPDVIWGDSLLSSSYVIDDGVPRIMLKGIPPFLFLALMIEVFCAREKWSKSVIFFFVASLVALVIDGSRAMIAASLVAAIISVWLYFISGKKSLIYFFFYAIPLCFVFFIVFNTNLFRGSDPEIEGPFSQVDASSVSEAYRIIEAINVVDVVKNIYFGNGLGATFFTIANGSESEDGEGTYVHSFPFWVYLKFGLTGVIICLLVYIKSFLMLSSGVIRCSVLSKPSSIHLINIFFLLLLLSSLITNQLVTFTGAFTASLLSPALGQKFYVGK